MSLTPVHLAGSPGQPLLILGPSLGTSVQTLWSAAAELLADDFHVIGWDLPGHGNNREPLQPDLSIEYLAQWVIDLATTVAGPGAVFHYAGNSVGGAVGLQLALDAPDRVRTATLSCTGARLGTEAYWAERAAAVTAAGTTSLVTASAQRWFAPGFLDRHPDRGSALLHALSETDDSGYAAVCRALGVFDVRGRLGEIRTPVLAVAGEADEVTPAALLADIAGGVQDGRLARVPDSAHLAPVEQPETVAQLLLGHALHRVAGHSPATDLLEAGMAVRQAVLGKAHVDRATTRMTSFTEDFQRFITEYAWGGIWTRPGLDRQSRSIITLTALVARGHHEELAMHVQAARRNGLGIDQIKEVILQTAVYCGVPAANAAFQIAQRALVALGELDEETD